MPDELIVEPGTLLAAWPDLMDPSFMHSVVAMCQHSADGACGVVVNRVTELTIGDLLPDHPLLGGLAFPVHLGGTDLCGIPSSNRSRCMPSHWSK